MSQRGMEGDMNAYDQPSRVPSSSDELLRRFAGKRLLRLLRYSWWPAEDVAAECGVHPSAAFSLTAGPLAMTFEGGGILGVASDPSQNSVVVWLDRDDGGTALRVPPMDDDPEVFPIEASDHEFSQPVWTGLVGRALIGASVLHMRTASALKIDLPNEVGLRLQFDGGQELIAAHGLHDRSDDFAVLSRGQVLPDLREELEERPLF